MPLLDLPAELLVAIVAQLLEDDELAFALACCRLRKALAGTEQHARGRRAAVDEDRLGVRLGAQASYCRSEGHAACSVHALLRAICILLAQLRRLRAHVATLCSLHAVYWQGQRERLRITATVGCFRDGWTRVRALVRRRLMHACVHHLRGAAGRACTCGPGPPTAWLLRQSFSQGVGAWHHHDIK
jgi:hypothetical protein